jgi:hypothetical protein
MTRQHNRIGLVHPHLQLRVEVLRQHLPLLHGVVVVAVALARGRGAPHSERGRAHRAREVCGAYCSAPPAGTAGDATPAADAGHPRAASSGGGATPLHSAQHHSLDQAPIYY